MRSLTPKILSALELVIPNSRIRTRIKGKLSIQNWKKNAIKKSTSVNFPARIKHVVNWESQMNRGGKMIFNSIKTKPQTQLLNNIIIIIIIDDLRFWIVILESSTEQF